MSLDFTLCSRRHDIDEVDAFDIWTLAASDRVPAVPSEPFLSRIAKISFLARCFSTGEESKAPQSYYRRIMN